jgi:hypothetical protein
MGKTEDFKNINMSLVGMSSFMNAWNKNLNYDIENGN